MKKIWSCLLTLSVVVALAAGCGQGATNTSANPDNSASSATKKGEVDVSKPATVKILAGNINDEVFQYMIVDPMSKKYPQITVEKMSGKLADLIAAGDTPDLMTDWNGAVPSMKPYDLLMDMTPLIKKHNFDLSRFQQPYIDAIKVASDKGEIYALPYYAQLNALYYNKDLFDKFGVPYPKDGMTWDDAIDLAAKVTRQENGVQIQGLNFGGVQRLAFPFSPDIVSAKTLKATVVNDTWKRAFQYGQRITSIPGNRKNLDFLKGQVAMWANVGDALPNIKKAVGEGFISLGVAQYPQFKELPNTYGMVDAHYIFVTKTSKVQDAAMKVIETMTSDEVQMSAAKTYARLSPLKNPELQKQFGADFLPGVDMQSIFKSKVAPGQVFTEYYPKAKNIVLKDFDDVADGKTDINTALRSAEEEINKMVAEDQSGK